MIKKNERETRLVWLSNLLDSSIPIGNSGRSIGLDPFSQTFLFLYLS